MPSNRVNDSIEIYRFKITTTVESEHGLYRHKNVGINLWESVEFVGFYTTKYKYTPWIPSKGTMVIEHQGLTARYDADPLLEWETFAVKRYEDGEPV